MSEESGVELLNSRQGFEQLLDGFEDVVYVVTPDGELTYWNDALEEVTGYTDADIETMSPAEFFVSVDQPRVRSSLGRVLDTGERVTTDVHLKTANGDALEFEFSVEPLIEGDETVAVAGIGRDITERKEREEAFLRMTEEYETIFQNAQDGIFLLDVDSSGEEATFEFSRLNRKHEELSGLKTEEVEGKTPTEVLGQETGAKVEANYRRCFRQRDTISYRERLEMPEGPIVWQTRLSPVIVDDEVMHVVGVARDVTDTIERERELERYERIVEDVPVGVYRVTPGDDGEFVFGNAAMMDMFGAPSTDALAEYSVSDLYVNPDERGRLSDRIIEEGLVENEEVRLQTLDGEELWGEVTAIRVEEDGDVYFDGAIQDITERKQYEDRLQSQMEQLEVLNRIVRHDIRNDMTVVLGMVEVVSDQIDDPEARDRLGKVLSSSEHIVELTRTARDLMEAMLSESREREPVWVSRVLEDEADDIGSSYEGAIVQIDAELPRIQVYADDLLESVFRNVLKNAVQHNDEDIAEIEVGIEDGDDHVVVSIADNGPGIPDSHKTEIFGKGEKGLESEGTGIGLYLVHSLVDSYGGDVWVEDNDPKGSVFKVELEKVTN
jgi:PAS domain S-box-containing protein